MESFKVVLPGGFPWCPRELKNEGLSWVKDSSCIFCQIIDEKADGSIVYRDDLVTAFMDIRPVNPGHLLVVPNDHAADLSALDDEEVTGHIFKIGKRLAQNLRQTDLNCKGVNLHMADGAAAGQDVFHTHLHVIPRFGGDGLGFLIHGQGHVSPSREDLDETAEKITQALAEDVE
jgi:histidine triad (HIT) family protein